MYKPTKEQQISWYDSRFVCEQIVAKDALYREIRQICDQFVREIDFSPYILSCGGPAGEAGKRANLNLETEVGTCLALK